MEYVGLIGVMINHKSSELDTSEQIYGIHELNYGYLKKAWSYIPLPRPLGVRLQILDVHRSDYIQLRLTCPHREGNIRLAHCKINTVSKAAPCQLN